MVGASIWIGGPSVVGISLHADAVEEEWCWREIHRELSVHAVLLALLTPAAALAQFAPRAPT